VAGVVVSDVGVFEEAVSAALEGAGSAALDVSVALVVTDEDVGVGTAVEVVRRSRVHYLSERRRQAGLWHFQIGR
jgi:hypothetical protein